MRIYMVYPNGDTSSVGYTWLSSSRTVWLRLEPDELQTPDEPAIQCWEYSDSQHGGSWSRVEDPTSPPEGAELLTPRQALGLCPHALLLRAGLASHSEHWGWTVEASPISYGGPTLIFREVKPKDVVKVNQMTVSFPFAASLPKGAQSPENVRSVNLLDLERSPA